MTGRAFNRVWTAALAAAWMITVGCSMIDHLTGNDLVRELERISVSKRLDRSA